MVNCSLPIDARLGEIVEAVRVHRRAVIVAAPGAGKTTRVPPALSVDGPVAVLQPRRVAARALARRVADERGWTLGREVGWQVRGDRRYDPDTRVLFMTEGVLAARLQRDPLATAFRTIVLDEFHERTIHADLAIAMAREAWRARDDLAIVVMSATIDASRVSAYLDVAPIVEIEGRGFPLEIEYRPGVAPAEAALEVVAGGARGVLCFLPGAFEIRRTIDDLTAARGATELDVLPLHGGLDADAQDRALRPSGDRPRVVVATNIAETSLTVPDVTAVVDAGLQRVARFDAARGIDVLVTERITRDAADQRAGRAGRVSAGRAVRLWSQADRLRAHREPELLRVDLAPAVLTLLAWGGDPRRVQWMDPPPAAAMDAAFALLARLGAIDAAGKLSPLGERMQALPVHPRLARMLIDAGGAFEAAAACALLSEPGVPARRGRTGLTTVACDLLPLIDVWRELPAHVRRAADDLMREAGGGGHVDEGRLTHALFMAFADRLARRREPGGRELLMASGRGATLAAESGVVGSEFLVCLDVGTSTSGSVVRLASAVDRAWLTPTHHEVVHRLGDDGRVRADRTDYVDALPLATRSVPVDPTAAAAALHDAWLARAADDPDVQQLIRRMAHAGLEMDLRALVETAAPSPVALNEIDPRDGLPYEARAVLERRSPDSLILPSGRRVHLEYRDVGVVVASARLQELFGLLETPRAGATPVTFELLSPGGRPVQITKDLASFWRSGYAEVRKELRARYPRHPWPEDPYTATPTARTKPRTR